MNTRTLLLMPYLAARTPLSLVDTKLVKRLPVDSPPRLAFERLVGSVDAVAGRLLRDSSVESSGTERRERADTLSQAVRLEQDAAAHRQAADEAITQGAEQADQLRDAAERQQHEGIQTAVATERKDKQAATERAQARAEQAKDEADARAAAKLATVERQRKQAEARATGRKQRAGAAAKSELTAATQKRQGARARRAEADQLGDLAEAKQEARKNS